MRTRQPNGASSIYKGKDGYWHGRVTVGVKDNGEPDRRHFQATTRPAIVKKVRTLEKARDSGGLQNAGKKWSVKSWLEYWLDNVAALSVRDNAFDAYRIAVQKHLVPRVGAHRLDRLEPEHLERMYADMQKDGSAPATAHQVHRTIRTSLGEAMRRGHIARNPATLAKAPRLPHIEIQPYSVEEVQRLLSVASQRRNSARWAVALALGLRQGEALGLKWDDIDLEGGHLYVRRNRLRPKWKHGCKKPCGRVFAGYCPERISARSTTAETKSKAGRRAMGLPAPLIELLKQHEKEQDKERKAAAQLWRDEGWVFATPTGGAISHSTDYGEWKRLLVESGIRNGRLHDARHTAATVLLILGVPERVVMGVMGWAATSMAARYQHLTDGIRQDVASRVGNLLWGAPKTRHKTITETETETKAMRG